MHPTVNTHSALLYLAKQLSYGRVPHRYFFSLSFYCQLLPAALPYVLAAGISFTWTNACRLDIVGEGVMARTYATNGAGLDTRLAVLLGFLALVALQICFGPSVPAVIRVHGSPRALLAAEPAANLQVAVSNELQLRRALLDDSVSVLRLFCGMAHGVCVACVLVKRPPFSKIFV